MSTSWDCCILLGYRATIHFYRDKTRWAKRWVTMLKHRRCWKMMKTIMMLMISAVWIVFWITTKHIQVQTLTNSIHLRQSKYLFKYRGQKQIESVGDLFSSCRFNVFRTNGGRAKQCNAVEFEHQIGNLLMENKSNCVYDIRPMPWKWTQFEKIYSFALIHLAT